MALKLFSAGFSPRRSPQIFSVGQFVWPTTRAALCRPNKMIRSRCLSIHGSARRHKSTNESRRIVGKALIFRCIGNHHHVRLVNRVRAIPRIARRICDTIPTAGRLEPLAIGGVRQDGASFIYFLLITLAKVYDTFQERAPLTISDFYELSLPSARACAVPSPHGGEGWR